MHVQLPDIFSRLPLLGVPPVTVFPPLHNNKSDYDLLARMKRKTFCAKWRKFVDDKSSIIHCELCHKRVTELIEMPKTFSCNFRWFVFICDINNFAFVYEGNEHLRNVLILWSCNYRISKHTRFATLRKVINFLRYFIPWRTPFAQMAYASSLVNRTTFILRVHGFAQTSQIRHINLERNFLKI